MVVEIEDRRITVKELIGQTQEHPGWLRVHRAHPNKFVLFNEENLKYFTANVVGQMPPTATLLRWWAEALKKDAPFLDLATVLRAPEFAQVQLLFFTKRTHEIQTLIGQAGSEILGPNADVEALVKQLAAKIRQMID